MNQLDFWQDDIDSRNKVWFVNFCLGVVENQLYLNQLTNQISRFLNQLY